MKVYDAIVVGSGATGGWAAKQLCEGGMEVLMLEAGRKLDPAKDFQEHTWPYQLPFRGFGKPGDIEVTSAQRSPLRQRIHHAVLRQRRRSAVHHPRRQTVQLDPLPHRRRPYFSLGSPDLPAEQLRSSRPPSHDGHGQNWPIRYEDLAPYYDIVESFIGVSGSAEGYEALPDGKFLPPMNFSCGEMQLKKVVESYGDRIMTIGRAAILTQKHEGTRCLPLVRPLRARLHDRFIFLHAFVHAAGRHENRQAHAADRRHRASDPEGQRRQSPRDRLYRRPYRQDREVYGKVVMLNASTLESTRLLMLSNMGTSNDALGHYLMDHTIDCRVLGFLPAPPGPIAEFDDNRANGLYIPRFRNLKTKHPDYIRGWGYQGEAIRGMFPTHAAHRAGLRRRVQEERPRGLALRHASLGFRRNAGSP